MRKVIVSQFSWNFRKNTVCPFVLVHNQTTSEFTAVNCHVTLNWHTIIIRVINILSISPIVNHEFTKNCSVVVNTILFRFNFSNLPLTILLIFPVLLFSRQVLWLKTWRKLPRSKPFWSPGLWFSFFDKMWWHRTSVYLNTRTSVCCRDRYGLQCVVGIDTSLCLQRYLFVYGLSVCSVIWLLF